MCRAAVGTAQSWLTMPHISVNGGTQNGAFQEDLNRGVSSYGGMWTFRSELKVLRALEVTISTYNGPENPLGASKVVICPGMHSEIHILHKA